MTAVDVPRVPRIYRERRTLDGLQPITVARPRESIPHGRDIGTTLRQCRQCLAAGSGEGCDLLYPDPTIAMLFGFLPELVGSGPLRLWEA